jgi:WD40 repeat protein
MKGSVFRSKRKTPAAVWVAIGVVIASAAMLWWDPIKVPVFPLPGRHGLAWQEINSAPLTGPDSDPLPPGAIVRLGRVRLRQGPGPAVLAFSPDGKTLASVESPRLDLPGKHLIHLWEVATGKEVGHLESAPQHYIWNIQFSPDGKRLSVLGNLFPSNGNEFGNWIFSDLELATGKEVRELKEPSIASSFTQAVVSTDTTLIAWKNPENWAIHIQDITSGKEVLQFAAQEDEQPERFTADGSRLICLGHHKNAYRIRDVATGAERELPLFPRAIKTTFSPDGMEILAWEHNGPVRCWDVTAGREEGQLDNPDPGRTVAVALSPDGKIAAAGYSYGDIRWWNRTTGELGHHIHAHSNRVGTLTFSRDGKILASMQLGDGAIQLWDVATGDKLSPREGHQAGLASLSVASDGKTIATVGEDHTLRIWNATNGQELRRLRTSGTGVAFSPDGKTLATTGERESADRAGTVWLLDTSTGEKVRTFAGKIGFPYRTLAFSADGTKLLGAGFANDSCVWHVASSKVLRQFGTGSLALSPDGTLLAEPFGGTIGFWDLADEHLPCRLWPTRAGISIGRITSLLFSCDGKMLAVAAEVPRDQRDPRGPQDGVIRVYEVTTGDERTVLNGHRKLVTSLQFAPDGKTLVSGSEDGTVRVWDVASGKDLRRFEGHRDKVTCVAFAPDGRTVISGSGDSTALVWDVEHTGQH